MPSQEASFLETQASGSKAKTPCEPAWNENGTMRALGATDTNYLRSEKDSAVRQRNLIHAVCARPASNGKFSVYNLDHTIAGGALETKELNRPGTRKMRRAFRRLSSVLHLANAQSITIPIQSPRYWSVRRRPRVRPFVFFKSCTPNLNFQFSILKTEIRKVIRENWPMTDDPIINSVSGYLFAALSDMDPAASDDMLALLMAGDDPDELGESHGDGRLHDDIDISEVQTMWWDQSGKVLQRAWTLT